MSQVTAPILLDSTGQAIVAKLQDIVDAIGGSGGYWKVRFYTPKGNVLLHTEYVANGSNCTYGSDLAWAASPGGAESPGLLDSITQDTDAYLYVPDTYTNLSCVQLVTGAYINVGIVPSNHLTELSVNDVSYVDKKNWIGTSAGANYYHFSTYSNKYYWGRNGSEASAGAWSSGDHFLEYNKGSNYQVYLDGVCLGSNSGISSGANLEIGRRGTNAIAADFRVYFCRVTNKGTNELVRYLVPVIRNSDNEVGFFDVINNAFYANAGSGSLIAGA